MKKTKISKKALRRVLTVNGIIKKWISKYSIEYKIFVWSICHIALPFISHNILATLIPGHQIRYEHVLTSVNLYQRGAYAELLMKFYLAKNYVELAYSNII